MSSYNVRSEIEDTRKLLGITKDCFSEVGMTKWENIQRKFEEKFIEKKSYKSSFYWYWEHFNCEAEAINANGIKYFVTKQLFEKNEIVYFFVLDNDKFWFYEGDIYSINEISYECGLNEYYILDKKYEWFMACTHHLTFIGCGEKIITKMRAFIEKESEIIEKLNKKTPFYDKYKPIF